MFKKIVGLVCLAFLFTGGLIAQDEVQWMTIEEAADAMKTEKRKIFVDMYTDWCGWCKKMDAATFQKAHIAKYLNSNFYPVKFDAEQKEEIVYKEKSYRYVKSGRRGYNELAAEFAKSLGRLSFPTIIFIDEELNVLQPIPGFQDPQTFEIIMTYFAEDHFKDTPWKKYHKNYLDQMEGSVERKSP
jgi:thioredoxin-related protein